MTRLIREITDARVRRDTAWEFISGYHDQQLRLLQEHVREGLLREDAGEIDAFELDAVIHQYHRAAQKLWIFCNSPGGEDAALTVEWWREHGEPETDWWEAGEPGRQGR